MDFQDTLTSAKSGDSRAEHELFDRWRALLNLHAARSIPRNCAARVDPSDVVQEALTQASRDLAGFRGTSQAQWVRWLQTIVAGEAVRTSQHHQAQKRDVQRDVEPTVDLQAGVTTAQPLQALEQLEEAAVTAEALLQLPDDMKRAISYRVFEQLSWREIAELLGKSESAVRVLWTRGLRKLKEIIDQ